MKKLLLILVAISFNSYAIDNEDCYFEDAAGQKVTQIRVSCADKRAEFVAKVNDNNTMIRYSILEPKTDASDPFLGKVDEFNKKVYLWKRVSSSAVCKGEKIKLNKQKTGTEYLTFKEAQDNQYFKSENDNGTFNYVLFDTFIYDQDFVPPNCFRDIESGNYTFKADISSIDYKYLVAREVYKTVPPIIPHNLIKQQIKTKGYVGEFRVVKFDENNE